MPRYQKVLTVAPVMLYQNSVLHCYQTDAFKKTAHDAGAEVTCLWFCAPKWTIQSAEVNILTE